MASIKKIMKDMAKYSVRAIYILESYIIKTNMGLRKIKTEILDLPSIIFGIHLTLDFAKTSK